MTGIQRKSTLAIMDPRLRGDDESFFNGLQKPMSDVDANQPTAERVENDSLNRPLEVSLTDPSLRGRVPPDPLPRNVRVLGLVSLTNDIASEAIYPLLPAFLFQVLGGNRAVLGIIEGVSESWSSLLKLYFGKISDRLRQRKWIVGLGYAMSAIGRPCIGIVTSPWQLFAARILDRSGKGVRTAHAGCFDCGFHTGANAGPRLWFSSSYGSCWCRDRTAAGDRLLAVLARSIARSVSSDRNSRRGRADDFADRPGARPPKKGFRETGMFGPFQSAAGVSNEFIDVRAENRLILQAVIPRIPGFRWSPRYRCHANVSSGPHAHFPTVSDRAVSVFPRQLKRHVLDGSHAGVGGTSQLDPDRLVRAARSERSRKLDRGTTDGSNWRTGCRSSGVGRFMH